MMLPALFVAAAAFAAGVDTVFVSPAWLSAHREDPRLVVVQVSMSEDEYVRAHVPGARLGRLELFHDHMMAGQLPPASQLVRGVEQLGISNQSRVVLVGDPIAAALVYVALDFLGHGASTVVLDGGLPAWRKAGFPVSSVTPTFDPGHFVPRVRTDLIATADWIAARLSDSSIRLLDARSAPEYAGTTHDEGLPRFGHIPGAIHLDWRATLTSSGPAGSRSGPESDNSPSGEVLRPAAELLALFRDAHVGDREVVTYCTVGMRASHLYLVARSLGLRTRIYVGSISDWSGKPALPIATGTSPR